MEITSLKCNNCGANLDINPKIKFFTCTFCKSSLTIKKSGNVIFTEVLDEIKENTETLIDNSEKILIEKKIARLDRDWLREREKFQFKDDKGNIELPTEKTPLIPTGGIVIAICSIIFFVILFANTSPNSKYFFSTKTFFIPFILIIILAFILQISADHSNNIKVNQYQAAKEQYLTERNTLLTELENAKE